MLVTLAVRNLSRNFVVFNIIPIVLYLFKNNTSLSIPYPKILIPDDVPTDEMKWKWLFFVTSADTWLGMRILGYKLGRIVYTVENVCQDVIAILICLFINAGILGNFSLAKWQWLFLYYYVLLKLQLREMNIRCLEKMQSNTGIQWNPAIKRWIQF